MHKSLNTIGVICRRDKPIILESVEATIACLKSHNKTVLLDNYTAQVTQNTQCEILPSSDIGNACELIIVVGGDGSLLNAVHDVIDSNTPVLGINRGRLGFLTDITPETLPEQLAAILGGAYSEEQRFLLEATVSKDNQTLGQDIALNEVALLPDLKPHMVDFEVHVDNQFLFRERSDGLLAATPTGSTAYALSGGGPILHPELDSVVLVPMFAHTLTSRPIVLNANHTITIDISEKAELSPRISCDGKSHLDVPPGGRITITKYQQRLRLIHPLEYDYFDALRTKLHWGKKHYHEN